MEVDPVNEEPTQAGKTAAVATVTTTGKRYVLKRRLQNGAISSPSNGNGEASSNGGILMPQLVSTATGSAAVSPGVAHLAPRGPSGGLKIRKIEP